MAEGSAPDGAEKQVISLIVKPTAAQGSIKYLVDIEASQQVQDLKLRVQEASNISPEQQRLIYKGQILKDERTIESYGIGHEHVLHLVRSRATGSTSAGDGQPSTAAATAPAAGARAAPAAAAAPGAAGAAPIPGLWPGVGSNPMDMMGSPEMMSQMMNNPMVQSLLNNPEVLRSMMASNPMMQQLLERNPELGAMLNDPAVLRQSLQLVSNPALLREHMRHADRAMSNIEAMPEGFNALRRMFETVQEPLMDAAQQMDPLAGLMAASGAAGARTGGGTGTTPTGTGTEAQPQQDQAQTGADAPSSTNAEPNASPLPNPWAAGGGGAGAGRGAPGGGAAPAGLGGLGLGGLAGLGGLGAGLGGLGGGPGGAGGPPQLAAMAQLMQQPGMRQLATSMMSSPAFMEQVLASNPALRQMVDSTPGMRAMLSNPAMVEAMFNPQTLQAMAAMQQAGGGGVNLPGAPPGGADQLSGMLNALQMLGPMGFGGAAAAAGAPPPVADPQVTFATQLSALADMGFTDTAANVRALQATGGNVHAAVDRLLSGL